MKFWEAMKAMQEGKKVRCIKWEKPDYIKTEDSTKCYLAAHVNDEWEIYKEPYRQYPFFGALSLLKGGRGKSMARAGWPLYNWLEIDALNYLDLSHCQGGKLSMIDIDAQDWIIK